MPKIYLGPILIAFAALLGALDACAVVQLTPTAVSAPPGAVVEVPIAFSGVADAPTIVIITFSYDSARVTPIGGVVQGPGVPADKSFDWNISGGTLYTIVYSLGAPFTAQNSIVLYFRIADDAPNGTYTVTRTGGSATNEALDDLATTLAPLSITVNENLGTHNADTTGDWAISLSEVLRIIQFYNTGSLHCEVGTEDGFAPGPGDQTCSGHDSDYVPQNWVISLSEVLRIIQFYNFIGGSYHPDAQGEDGYAPGPF